MFATPLPALIDPALVPGPILVLTLVLSCGVLLRDWRAIYWQGPLWILAGRLPATAVAGQFIGLVSRDALLILFSLFVLVGVAVSLGRPRIASPPGTVRCWLASLLLRYADVDRCAAARLVYQGEKGTPH